MLDVFTPTPLEYDEFGSLTGIRTLLSDLVATLPEKGVGFTFGHRLSSSQFDVLSIQNEEGQTLGSRLASFYEDSSSTEASAKFFLKSYLCYVEVPTYRMLKETGEKVPTFDKYLATASLEVVSSWLGVPLEEAETKYGSHVSDYDEYAEFTSAIPFFKLRKGKNGPVVTRVKKQLELATSGLRVVPLFALDAYVSSLYKLLNSDLLSISFFKDNGTERKLNTTLSKEVLESYYTKEGYAGKVLSPSFQGSLLGSSALERGYIRLPEVGASYYDDSGIRAVSYTRITSVTKDPELNLEYIDVDLSRVVPSFAHALLRMDSSKKELLVHQLKASGFPESNLSPYDLDSWVDTQNRVFSTTFQQELHSFMLSESGFFPEYLKEGILLDQLQEIESNDLIDLDDLW